MKTLNFPYIDALRGYAILLVMAVHTSQLAVAWGGVGRAVVDQGARGVQLFFVASALTLVMSWRSRNDGILRFYVRRLFRIAPMFWLGIIFFVWLDGFGPRYFAPNGIDEKHVILTSLFMHGWHPEYITSVVHGGWSIAVEMMFYLVFPVMIFFIRGWVSALTCLVLANFFANMALQLFWLKRSVLWPGISDDLVSTFLNLWFPSQLPVFVVGFLVFFVVRDAKGVLPVWSVRLLLFFSLLAMLGLALDQTPIRVLGQTISIYVSYALCFGLFAFCLAEGAANWLVNVPIRYLGKVSFSAYLWHFAVLGSISALAKGGVDPLNLKNTIYGFYFFCGFFPFLILVTTFLSTITYRLVERPMISIGNNFLKKFHNKDAFPSS
jgi:peptidoglycan/LPS O-acetylase OafA/YrhL